MNVLFIVLVYGLINSKHICLSHFRDSKTPDYVIVRNSLDPDNQEEVELELEEALAMEVKHIIIEPFRLGTETAAWIKIGNFLHKASVVSGAVSLSAGYFQRDLISLPFAVASVLTSGMYALSWASDPCCKYQIEMDIRKVEDLPLQTLSSTTAVVLVRKDDSRRKYLQNIVSISAIVLCVCKLYNFHFSSIYNR